MSQLGEGGVPQRELLIEFGRLATSADQPRKDYSLSREMHLGELRISLNTFITKLGCHCLCFTYPPSVIVH